MAANSKNRGSYQLTYEICSRLYFINAFCSFPDVLNCATINSLNLLTTAIFEGIVSSFYRNTILNQANLQVEQPVGPSSYDTAPPPLPPVPPAPYAETAPPVPVVEYKTSENILPAVEYSSPYAPSEFGNLQSSTYQSTLDKS